MNPDRICDGIQKYISALRKDASMAQAFFEGRWEEGMKQFLTLPLKRRLEIEGYLWEVSKGDFKRSIDGKSAVWMTEAILRSLEHRLGID